MKIGELEEQLQITRSNIRFYEKEGLLSPKRKGNGYREYSVEDAARLKQIAVLRKIGISIPDIKALLEERTEFSSVLKEHEHVLQEQIDTLNGALFVCRKMEEDKVTIDDFDEDYYWNLIHAKEAEGQKFIDLVKDFAQFEKNVFFSTLGRIVVGKRFVTGACVIGAVCVGRGMLLHFLGGSDFVYETLYPLFLCVMLALLMVPIYVITKMYPYQETEEEEPSHKYLNGFAIAGLIVVYFVVTIVLNIVTLEKWLLPKLVDDKYTYAFMIPKFSSLQFIATLAFLFLWIWLFYRGGLFGGSLSEEKRFVCRLPFHLRWKIFGVAMIMYLLLFASQLVCNEVYTEDGMVSRFFGITKHYAWEDVVSYRITDNFDDTLMVRVKMEDGRSYTLMGGLVCVWMTLEPEESDTDSVEYITRMALERIHRNGVRSEVNWEKVHKECMEYWSDYAGELQQILGE